MTVPLPSLPLSVRRVAALFVVAAVGAAGTPARAAEPASETCAMRLAEARFEVDELSELEQLAPVRRDAERDIYELVKPLWEANIAARLEYLEHRFDRDRFQIEVPRSRIERERGEAKLAVIETECLNDGKDATASRRRFEELSCQLVGKEREMAAVEVAYREDVVAVLAELRSRELVTEQRLIDARFQVESARAEERLRAKRHRTCSAALASRAGGAGGS